MPITIFGRVVYFFRFSKKEGYCRFFSFLLTLLLSTCFFAHPLSAQTTKKTTKTKTTAKATTKKKTAAKKKTRKTKKATTTDSRKQKKAAETERGKVRKQLSDLKKEIGKTETAKGKAEDTLAKSEAAIKNTNRSIEVLEKKQSSTEARLTQLTEEQTRLETTISRQQDQLAGLLQEHYIYGNEDRMKFLLSGDNPNRINRELQYMAYISKAQSDLTSQLKNNLHAVDSKRSQTASTKQELEKISQEKQIQKQKLEKEKAAREVLLAQLSSKLEKQKQQAKQLAQDEKRLSALVDNLAKKIAAQRKAAEAKRRRAKGSQKVEVAADAESAKSAFAKQKGRMKLPVKGTITARYGSKRADGPSWKGIFIETPKGTAIRSVANGEVVFADWLRGFGNLIIVDHGAQYMTIYANAQTLRKKVGDNVKGGEVIANVGNSSDNSQTGLYFEMRHKGRAFNPMNWVTIR